ncbi:hypothetical protein FACS189425_05650 [Clostridia bacterium]|nr:hypothetical protein FACS189425_05650 [Clostridia bacterium]
MIQSVRANDRYESELFRWDKTHRMLSLPHGKEVWFLKLAENGEFQCLRSEPILAAVG